jgi:mRNA-degrading endonuclease RelE of RelBE toxin-antitoxin system
LSQYTIEYDPRTESELRRLPLPLRKRIDVQLEYLRAAPFRSHPGLKVKATREVHGVWHFHVTKDVRVFYTTYGSILWVVLVERSRGVSKSAVRDIRKRL